MYLWNYISSKLAENGQPEMSSIGYYDESSNSILCTFNEKKWQISVPQGLTERDALLLYMANIIPQIKEYIDDNDKARLFNPVVTEITPPEPASEPVEEPVETPEETPVEEAQPSGEIMQDVAEEYNMNIIKCERCGLFYDAANYDDCPFCSKNEAETIIEADDIGTTGDGEDTSDELATVRFIVNDELHSLVAVNDGELITLGRAAECNIFYTEEKQLSRVHCTIQYDESEKAFFVTDRSLNGMFDTTGNRLPKDTTIKMPGDSTLWVANKSMLLQLSASKTQAERIYEQPVEVPVYAAPVEAPVYEEPVQNICNNCHGEYAPDSTFCPWCGNRVAN